jgi:hypothetical protein
MAASLTPLAEESRRLANHTSSAYLVELRVGTTGEHAKDTKA